MNKSVTGSGGRFWPESRHLSVIGRSYLERNL
jgi:hypothetical protein